MVLPKNLHFFRSDEFKHPDLVDPEAAEFLDAVRAVYDSPLVITDDARTTEEVAARQNPLQGGSATSLHGSGRAFDIRWPATANLRYRLVEAINRVGQEEKYKNRIELELDHTAGNEHFHVGLRPTPTGSTLLLRG